MPVKFEHFDAKYNKYFAKSMRDDYILFACGLLHFDSDEVVERDKCFHIKKVKVLAKIAFKLLKLKVDSNENVTKQSAKVINTFVFDKEEEYNENSEGVTNLLKTKLQRSDLPIEQIYRNTIECILEREFREFNKFRKLHSEEVINKCTKYMKLTLNLSGGTLQIIGKDRKVKRAFFKEETDDIFI